jgi:hypothetical protein
MGGGTMAFHSGPLAEFFGSGGRMTGAQASYLKTLSDECGEPDSFQPGLTQGKPHR